jgi:hypothetical protein
MKFTFGIEDDAGFPINLGNFQRRGTIFFNQTHMYGFRYSSRAIGDNMKSSNGKALYPYIIEVDVPQSRCLKMRNFQRLQGMYRDDEDLIKKAKANGFILLNYV